MGGTSEVSVPEARRRAILVLGMHRSGTSVLARILNLLGCDFPRNLMSADEGNEAGFWESTQIRELNDRLLESADTEWDDWLELNPEWLQSPRAREFLEDACEVIEREYQDSGLFVVKDPRVCRIVPFWLEVFARLDVQPLVIFPLRNPLEVASSLEARDNIDVSYSHLLWLRHVLEAEYHTRGIPRYFTTYDQLITHWSRSLTEAQSVLGVEWPRKSRQSAEEVDAYVSEELRHHHEPVKKFIDDASLSEWLRVSCEIVFQWAEGGEDARAYDQLDRIRKEFNVAAPAFGKLLAKGRASQRHAKTLEDTLTHKINMLTRKNKELSTRTGEHEKQAREYEHQARVFEQQAREFEHQSREFEKEAREFEKEAREFEKEAREFEKQLTLVQKDAAVKLREKDAKVARISGQMREVAAAQLGEAISSLLDRTTWSFLGLRRMKQKIKALKHSGIVDAEWYLQNYPDVTQTGIDPLLHYVEFGVYEGREPNPRLAKVMADT